MSEETIEEIKVSTKEIPKYLSACFVALSNDKNTISLLGRGSNIKRAVDVGAIMLREHLDVPKNIPTIDDIDKELVNGNIENARELLGRLRACEIRIGSEKYTDNSNERFVSTIEILLRGKRKNVNSRKENKISKR